MLRIKQATLTGYLEDPPAEVLDQPVAGLIVDQDIEMSDPGVFEAVFKARLQF